MAEQERLNHAGRPVAVIVGATSKWHAGGRSTLLFLGEAVEDQDLPLEVRWGVGGAVALKFAREGMFVVLTTRKRSNAAELASAVEAEGGGCMIVELELTSSASISAAFAEIRQEAGDPDLVIYNAGYLEGRDLPPGQELLEFISPEIFEMAQQIAVRAPFFVAKEVLRSMRLRGTGAIFFSNNAFSLRGRKRKTGESLYYPRVMMRTLSQVLTEEYSEHGIHVANVVIDGFIDSPGTRALPAAKENPGILINPASIAEAFFYLFSQDRSCWSHEIQLTPSVCSMSY